ncbi:hypothetical protein [Nocardia jinanensis]|uniref:hypothetical protein n=1 Tax=Nocardia jinanensis TaxID=382504 RepID=UPI001E4E6457|nr:hypothetical protein [Nocardia jinanensis]
MVATLITGSLAMGFGTAHADPAAEAPKTVNYAVQLKDKTVVATINGGSFSIVEKDASPEETSSTAQEPGTPAGEPIAEGAEKAKVVEIKDGEGKLVASLPLEFTAAGAEIPVVSEVKQDGAVLEITPEKPAGAEAGQPKEVLHPVAKPIASPAENQMAVSEFSSNFGLATAIGGFIGTAVGFVVGCVVIPAIGCLPGAGLGGIIGTIAVGGPTLVAAGVELINTMQAPAGTSKWANGGEGPAPAPASAEAPVEAPK